MKIEFTGRRFDVPPELRKLAERKLGKLARLLPKITRAHVTFSLDGRLELVEVSLHSRHLHLSARETTRDAAASLSAAVDKLTRQAQKERGRRRERGRGAALGPRGGAAYGRDRRGTEPRTPSPPRIVRSRRPEGKPMTLDEAAAEVLSREQGFLIFRDPRTERINVLYKRRDGNLGLIEPEA